MIIIAPQCIQLFLQDDLVMEPGEESEEEASHGNGLACIETIDIGEHVSTSNIHFFATVECR